MKTTTYTAFVARRQLAAGALPEVAVAVKAAIGKEPTSAALVFEDATGRVIDLDLRGNDEAIVRRLDNHPLQRPAPLQQEAKRGPGRPRLGVVAREVTLLPRHWDWLNAQPGGASVALRKLVEEARRSGQDSGRVRRAQEAAYRFMSAIAGNEPGYEEATRALFAGNRLRYDAQIADWPADIRAYALRLAEDAFTDPQRAARSRRNAERGGIHIR